MKTTVALEFEANELESFAIKLLTKVAWKLASSQDPAVQAMFGAVYQGIAGLTTSAMSGARPQARVSAGYVPQPGGVRPIRETGAVEHCFPVDESRFSEAAWVCCGCATPNGTTRTHCRLCGHGCCVPGAPSPPGVPPQPDPPAPEAS
jgi:hypothetical protein